jgi:hypothetical protein
MLPHPSKIATYEDFLRASIKRYWEAPGSSKRTFLALLLATEEAWSVAWDETRKFGFAKPVLAAAASLATITVLLRFLASGPLGFLVTGVSAGSLVALYATEQDAIRERAESVKRVVGVYRAELDGLLDERKGRHIRDAQWELMMEGLMGRFLEELHDAPDARFDPASAGGFAEHMHSPTLRPKGS